MAGDSTRDKRRGRASSSNRGGIRKRDRNFDPELRILASRTGTPARARGRSPVSKSLRETSSIISPIRGARSASRETEHTLSLSDSLDSCDDDTSSVSSFASADSLDSKSLYRKQHREGEVDHSHADETWNHPLLMKDRTALRGSFKVQFTDETTDIEASAGQHTMLVSSKSSQETVKLPRGSTTTTKRVSMAPDTKIHPTATISSTTQLPDRSSIHAAKRRANIVEKLASILRCGKYEYSSHRSSINNAMDLVQAASADADEIKCYMRNRPTESKFPQVDAAVRSLTALETAKAKNSVPTASVKKNVSFSQRAKIRSLATKGNNYASLHRYEDAVQCYMSIVEAYLASGVSSDDDPAVERAVQKLLEYHHKYSSLQNSDVILQMGLEHENLGRYVRAINYYTIAFRIRRDVVGMRHPSMIKLINMLGSLQAKRGHIDDALSFLVLAGELQEETKAGLVCRAVTERNVGAALEMAGNYLDALKHYHESFRMHRESRGVRWNPNAPATNDRNKISCKLKELLFEPVRTPHSSSQRQFGGPEEEGMEVSMESSISVYSVPLTEKVLVADVLSGIDADVDLAMTLHSIGRILAGRFEKYLFAMNAYVNSLDWMKHSLGTDHPNVAALLGNIGNVCMQMESYDRAHLFYQEVLRIEEKRFGKNHPEVAVTIFNIGTIEYARGRYSKAMTAFQRTMKMQKAVFGVDSALIGVASHSIGEVAERLNDLDQAMKSYQIALEIDQITLGKNHPQVGHLLHKMGRIQYRSLKNYMEAEKLCKMALEVYGASRFQDQDIFIRELLGDMANIRALKSFA